MRKVSFISNSEPVVRFGLRCGLFFAPLLGVLAFSVASLHLSGELMSPQEVLELQQNAGAIYYPLYQPKPAYPSYKLAGAARNNPEILVLGSSRGFSIRSEFTRAPQRFYNATLFGADKVGIMRQFLEHMPQDQLPRAVILTIDPWWFRKGAPVQAEPDYFEPASRMEIINFAWRNGISWGIRHRLSPGPAHLVGAKAKLQESGLRPDGSFMAGQRWLDTVPSLLDRQLRDLRDHADPWFHPASAGISPEALDELSRFLLYCKAHGSRVIAYMPTVHPALHKAIQAHPRLDYYQQTASALAPLFQQHGAAFFDLQDPAKMGCSAGEYLDAFHESEVCTIRVLLAMMQRDAGPLSIFDRASLEGFLERRESSWQLGF